MQPVPRRRVCPPATVLEDPMTSKGRLILAAAGLASLSFPAIAQEVSAEPAQPARAAEPAAEPAAPAEVEAGPVTEATAADVRAGIAVRDAEGGMVGTVESV